MKQSNMMITFLLTALFVVPNVNAATSEVTWTDSESYRDIKPGEQNRKRFEEDTFKNFEKHFTKMAATLPEGKTLKIEITDVDLAGDTHLAGINRTRIVKQNYPPRLNFSYQLMDENGKVIQSDDVVLKDMNFMSGTNLKYRNEAFGYEKKMYDDWFKKTFKTLIVSS